MQCPGRGAREPLPREMAGAAREVEIRAGRLVRQPAHDPHHGIHNSGGQVLRARDMVAVEAARLATTNLDSRSPVVLPSFGVTYMLDYRQQRGNGGRKDSTDRRRDERRRDERRCNERRQESRRAPTGPQADSADAFDGEERRNQDRRRASRRRSERRADERRLAERRRDLSRRRRFPSSDTGFLTPEERHFIQALQEQDSEH